MYRFMKIAIKFTAQVLLFAVFVTGLIPCVSVSSIDTDYYDIQSEVYRKNENQYKKIALTFDDGPHPRYTPRILDILDKYNVKATFFTVGINAHYYPEVLEQTVKRGHEIGNHTYTHPHVSNIDKGVLKSEVEKCENEIYGLTEYKTKLFRPPEGMIDNNITSMLRDLDYKVILWDIDTRDWSHTPPQKIANMIIENISSGDIILMHDYISYDSPTPQALDIFLPALIEMGFQFVTVSELIGLW